MIREREREEEDTECEKDEKGGRDIEVGKREKSREKERK